MNLPLDEFLKKHKKKMHNIICRIERKSPKSKDILKNGKQILFQEQELSDKNKIIGLITKTNPNLVNLDSWDKINIIHEYTSPLQYAIFKHDYKLVALLLEKGQDPNLVYVRNTACRGDKYSKYTTVSALHSIYYEIYHSLSYKVNAHTIARLLKLILIIGNLYNYNAQLKIGISNSYCYQSSGLIELKVNQILNNILDYIRKNLILSLHDQELYDDFIKMNKKNHKKVKKLCKNDKKLLKR